MVAGKVEIAGAADAVLDGRRVRYLDPQQGLFAAMLEGWDRQQTSRQLAPGTRAQRADVVRRFVAFTGSWPWQWTPSDVEDWTAHLRSAPTPQAHSTVRGYHNTVALFLAYVNDQRYDWAQRFEQLVGTHPVQVFHEWNTARHTSEHEARPQVRPFTRDELQGFLDFADDQFARARSLGRMDGCPRFATPPCSRSLTRGVCAGARSRCWTWPTSPATPPHRSSAVTASATSATARPSKAAHRDGPPHRQLALAVPRPPTRPTAAPDQPQPPSRRARHRPPRRPQYRPAPTRR